MAGRQTQEAFDLLFTDPVLPEGEQEIGVMLARPTTGRPMVVEEAFEPHELGQVSPPRPVPVIWDSWRNGAGVAKRVPGLEGAYTVARNACTRFGEVVTPAGAVHELALPPTTDRVLGFAQFGTEVIVLTADNQPLQIANGVSTPFVATTLSPTTTVTDAVTFGGKLWISGGQGELTSFDGTTWTQTATGQLARARMVTVTWTRGGVPRRRIVATNASGTAFVYTTGDDPANPAHWSSEIPIESAWPVQRLVAGARHAYALGPGGIFDLTEHGETPSITGETWSRAYNPSNGANGVLYDGRLFATAGSSTFMLELEGRVQDVMVDVSVGNLQPAELAVGDRPRALLVVDGWLAQITHTTKTDTSQLWYGMRQERTGSPAPWPMTWHGSECDLVGQDVQAAIVTAPTASSGRRMYLGTVDTATGRPRLFWHALHRYGSPRQDYLFGDDADRMDYARDWTITFTEETLGDPGTLKDPLWWDVLGIDLGGPNRLTVSAAGRDGAYVEQGVVTVDDARFGAQRVRDKAISVKVDGANSETVPATLEALKGSWVVTVEESGTIVIPVMFGEGVALLNGAEDTRDGAYVFAALLQLTERSSVELIRWDGRRVRARVEQGMRRRWQEDGKGTGWVDGAVLTVTVLTRPLIHDVDHHDLGLRHDG